MKLKDEILINKFGQGVQEISEALGMFDGFNVSEKRVCLNELVFFILQSKPLIDDVEIAITNSGLKKTYTPCILLKKGIGEHILQKIVSLPEAELIKSFTLLVNLFKIAYYRRFQNEKNDPHKWWYWDLSDESKVGLIKKGLIPRGNVY